MTHKLVKHKFMNYKSFKFMELVPALVDLRAFQDIKNRSFILGYEWDLCWRTYRLIIDTYRDCLILDFLYFVLGRQFKHLVHQRRKVKVLGLFLIEWSNSLASGWGLSFVKSFSFKFSCFWGISIWEVKIRRVSTRFVKGNSFWISLCFGGRISIW